MVSFRRRDGACGAHRPPLERNGGARGGAASRIFFINADDPVRRARARPRSASSSASRAARDAPSAGIGSARSAMGMVPYPASTAIASGRGGMGLRCDHLLESGERGVREGRPLGLSGSDRPPWPLGEVGCRRRAVIVHDGPDEHRSRMTLAKTSRMVLLLKDVIANGRRHPCYGRQWGVLAGPGTSRQAYDLRSSIIDGCGGGDFRATSRQWSKSSGVCRRFRTAACRASD